MKKTIKLNKINGLWYTKDREASFCLSGMDELWDIPKDCDEAWLVVSTNKLKESYEMIPLYYSETGHRIFSHMLMIVPESGNRYTAPTTAGDQDRLLYRLMGGQVSSFFIKLYHA